MNDALLPLPGKLQTHPQVLVHLVSRNQLDHEFAINNLLGDETVLPI